MGGNVTMAQLLANQLGPMMSRDGVDEREVEDFMKKVPVSLGKKKTLVSQADAQECSDTPPLVPPHFNAHAPACRLCWTSFRAPASAT